MEVGTIIRNYRVGVPTEGVAIVVDVTGIPLAVSTAEKSLGVVFRTSSEWYVSSRKSSPGEILQALAAYELHKAKTDNHG